jgi:phosphodiesterase/alkaline phosphatase D-like protein
MDTQLFSGHCQKKTLFWTDVWIGEDTLADRFTRLFSHCTKKEATVHKVLTSDLHRNFVNRLSNKAQQELQELSLLTTQTTLSDEPDKRQPSFSRGPAKLDPSAIYKLLKASDRAIS